MECQILILVRTASTRLPKKALLEINETPMILKLINRIKIIKNAKILVCTTNLKSDEKLVEILKKEKIEVFRGSNNNILKRILDATIKHKINECVIVEADDLFCDPELIKKTCNYIIKNNNEIIFWKDLPFGASPMGLKIKNLKKCIEENNINNSDTGWKEILINSNLFTIKYIFEKKKKISRPDIRLTIDYAEDYELAKIIFRELGEKFTLQDIIRLFDKNQELAKNNQKLQRKYEINYEAKKQIHANKSRS
jgi:spore coat polysaccharide biosynthesis protein SpsF